jgi:hypothetical protein
VLELQKPEEPQICGKCRLGANRALAKRDRLLAEAALDAPTVTRASAALGATMFVDRPAPKPGAVGQPPKRRREAAVAAAGVVPDQRGRGVRRLALPPAGPAPRGEPEATTEDTATMMDTDPQSRMRGEGGEGGEGGGGEGGGGGGGGGGGALASGAGEAGARLPGQPPSSNTPPALVQAAEVRTSHLGSGEQLLLARAPSKQKLQTMTRELLLRRARDMAAENKRRVRQVETLQSKKEKQQTQLKESKRVMAELKREVEGLHSADKKRRKITGEVQEACANLALQVAKSCADGIDDDKASHDKKLKLFANLVGSVNERVPHTRHITHHCDT